MKKIVALLLALVMVLSLVACGEANTEKPVGDETSVDSETPAWEWDGPIEIMCPAATGGGLDTTLHALQPYLEEELGTSIVIDCRSGGSGVVGFTYSYNETPRDGYYFQFTAGTPILSAAAGKFDVPVYDDIQAVSGCMMEEGVIFASAKAPFDDLQGMVDYAKANPKQVSIAIDAPTGLSGILATLFEQGAGVEFNWVIGGADESLISTIAGETDLLLATWADSAAYVESGDLKVICTLGPERNKVIGDYACSGDIGVDINFGYARVFTCLKGTPQEAADAFEAAVHRACTKAGWEEYLTSNGFTNDYLYDHEGAQNVIKTTYELGKQLAEG